MSARGCASTHSGFVGSRKPKSPSSVFSPCNSSVSHFYLKVVDKQLAAKIASGDAVNLTLPELIRASGSLRRQLHTVKSRGDTRPEDGQPNPDEPIAEPQWPFADPHWFAPKQKP